MLRITITVCLFILLTCHTSLAQSERFPEGLRKLTNKELMEMGGDLPQDLPRYGPDDSFWSKDKSMKMSRGMKYIPEYFADKNGKPVAIKFREITQEELDMIAQFEAERKRLEAYVGTEAKDFEVTDMEGNSLKLSEMRGSVIAINFWFIGCKPCIVEMPELNEIVKEFEGKPVKFVAIALDKESALKNFQQKRQFDYDIVPNGKSIAKLYEVNGYPTHCIVDQEGRIAYFKSAYSTNTAKEITNTLEKLLHE